MYLYRKQNDMAGKKGATILKEYEALNLYLKDQLQLQKSTNDLIGAAATQAEIIADRQRTINELKQKYADLTIDDKIRLDALVDLQREEVNQQKQLNKELEKSNKRRKEAVGLAKQLGEQLKIGWKYLQDSDKIIRTTILNLGMSGVKAEALRKSFEKSASYAAMLGGTLADNKAILEGYADETGRARVLTGEMLKDILAVGKGTGIGVEQATRLGAQFEIMGFDARKTIDYVQGIVDTSERMGVNTTKVLKNINDNFKKVNTYSFKAGSKGIADMAMNAEKMKVSMKDALSAADAAKGLESAIELAANLQVMGGEFAKTDPFEWMYLARNEPEKLTQKISEMTRGIVTFRKMSDGTFEKFISPADRQRLESVAKSLGISAEEMTEITQRRADLDKMNKELAGTGLSGREKELVQGAAIFNAKTGKFQVQLAGTMEDISSLTTEQAKAFVQERSTLEERAKQALTFDESFKATIEILKATLLPLLRGIQIVLNPLMKITTALSKWSDSGWGGVAAAAGLLILGAAAWKVTGALLTRAANAMMGAKAAGAVPMGGGGGTAPMVGSQQPRAKNGRFVKGAAFKSGARSFGQSAGIGAGVGLAAAGVGAGIGMAAVGVSKLADSMAKLTPEQAKTLQSITMSLGTFVLIGAGVAAAIILVGGASTGAALGLGIFAGAVAVVGAGIGVAAWGIGKMAEGLGTLLKGSKNAGKDLMSIAAGISAIGGAGLTASLTGGIGLVTMLSTISAYAPSIGKVGASFREISAALSGNAADYTAVKEAVEAISKVNTSGGGMLADLARLLKSPLKVEFADKNIKMTNDITLNIDGQKFMHNAYDVNVAIQKHVSAVNGTGGHKN